ncbi:hypothetical protein Prubr_50900 [Polymorphospora rubra]|uniref:Uncharacterized protein n=1 Tax=Polymorphospora rubra TaxID=338584 RepID=A0A810N7C5_9ACTN|nr:hypothetical protein Prubr_50900 [Polymorphospora rubra]
MVGPDSANSGVRSQTQISGTEAIIDISRSRTGSPRARNIGAMTSAWFASRRRVAIGGQQATRSGSTTGCFDIPLV